MSRAILVIAPHPDDEILGCGGVMARHASRNEQVHVAVITRGAPEIFPSEQVERVRKEALTAHKLLGVTQTHFLDFPAPRLDTIPGHELADGISKVIRSISPEVIYLPHRGDIHTDHRAVYQATLVACRPVEGSIPSELLCYETLSETEWAPPFGDDAFIPTVFAEITEHLSKKLDAMSCFASQIKNPPYSRSLKSIEALATVRGATVGVAAAEAFMQVRRIIR